MALWQSGDRISGKSDSATAALVWLCALVTGLLLGSISGGTNSHCSLRSIHSHSTGNLSDGAWPEAGVTRDAAGNFYGTTFFGGAGTGCDIYFGGCGTVFKVDDSGTETVLHSFGGAP